MTERAVYLVKGRYLVLFLPVDHVAFQNGVVRLDKSLHIVPVNRILRNILIVSILILVIGAKTFLAVVHQLLKKSQFINPDNTLMYNYLPIFERIRMHAFYIFVLELAQQDHLGMQILREHGNMIFLGVYNYDYG